MESESEQAQARKHSDATSYDAVAPTFDAMSERFSAEIADALLRRATIAPSAHVLDLGAGAGLLTVRAAQIATSGRVVGIDHSSGMLNQARQKAQRGGVSDRVEYAQMDAESLAFDPGSFDGAVSLFVLAHLPNPDAALRELHRVLRPGGRLVAGVGSAAPLLSLEGLGRAALRLRGIALAAQGRLASAPMFMRRLLAELGVRGQETEHVHAALDVPALMAAAGFEQIESSWAGSTFELGPEEFWEVCAVYGSNERLRLGALAADQRDEIKAEFMKRATAIASRGGKLVYQSGAAIFAAVKA